jgi:hypothetical protein
MRRFALAGKRSPTDHSPTMAEGAWYRVIQA